ncbi:MAG: hypothetical protein ACJAWV_003399 [Flammeovirgaceae bacterium]|jgi:hypothetical protein
MNEDIIIDKNLTAKPGEWFVDRIKVNPRKVFIHSNNISNMKVYKGKSAELYSGGIGATVIARKKHYNLISLTEFISVIRNQITNLQDKDDFEVIVEGNLISDLSEYKIESNPDIRISIHNLANENKGQIRIQLEN